MVLDFTTALLYAVVRHRNGLDVEEWSHLMLMRRLQTHSQYLQLQLIFLQLYYRQTLFKSQICIDYVE